MVAAIDDVNSTLPLLRCTMPGRTSLASCTVDRTFKSTSANTSLHGAIQKGSAQTHTGVERCRVQRSAVGANLPIELVHHLGGAQVHLDRTDVDARVPEVLCRVVDGVIVSRDCQVVAVFGEPPGQLETDAA